MIKKYTNKYDEIRMIEVIRESELSVFFKSGSNARKTASGGNTCIGTIYADTPEEVHAFIKAQYELKISQMKARLDYQIDALKNFEKYWEGYKNV